MTQKPRLLGYTLNEWCAAFILIELGFTIAVGITLWIIDMYAHRLVGG